jgi:hypothetical protein
MLTKWTSGLDVEAAKDVSLNFRESKVTRRRLQEIIKNKIEEARQEASSKSLYESPSWAYEQADRIGYERALRDMLNYLED